MQMTTYSTEKQERIFALYSRLTPLTSPYQDPKLGTIQLWKYGQSLIGGILSQEGRLSLVPASRIKNPLNPSESSDFLVKRLEASSSSVWDLAYHVETSTLTVWPHLIAAGKEVQPIRIQGSPLRYTEESHLIYMLERNGCKTGIQKDDPNVWIGGKYEYHLDREGEGNNPHEVTHVDVTHTPEYKEKLQKPILEKLKGYKDRYENDKNTLNQKVKNGQISEREARKEEYSIQKEYDKKKGELEKRLNFTDTKWRFAYGQSRPKDPPGGGKPELGYRDPGVKQFHQNINQANLNQSFRATHPHNPIPPKGGTGGQIGGVACSIDYIEGLFDGPEALFEKEHYFVLPGLTGENAPFSNEELSQILRELAIGIYAHSTVPFFSLHFNQDTDLFPIIHPVYQNTLVGRVIGMLDYIMKGYLNGGVFKEGFIDKWHRNPQWSTQGNSALQHLINFESYCKEQLTGEDKSYKSLRELHSLAQNISSNPQALDTLNMLGIPSSQEESDQLKNFVGFTNSFRIIAKQNSVQKHDNVFYIDADFDVFYTIEPSPAYQEALEQHIRKHGSPPQSYQVMLASYEFMKKRIHDHLVKFPLCKEYFSMLSVITFLSGYFSTLKKHRKFPMLPTIPREIDKGCPPLFPHLPIDAITEGNLEFNFKQCFNKVKNVPNSRLHLYLVNCLEEIRWRNSTDGLEGSFSADKQKAIEEIKKAVEENILELASPPMRRFLEKQREQLSTLSTPLSSSFLDQLMAAFLGFINSFVTSRSLHTLKPNREVISLLLDTFPWKDQTIKIGENIPYQETRIKTEMSLKEVEEGKKIVGGCGMSLKEEPVVPSLSAQTILRNNWHKLFMQLPENWTKLSDNSSHAFRLVYEDVPPFFCDDFQWMEFAYFCSEEEAAFLWNLNEALTMDDRVQFDRLINGSADLNKIADYSKKNALHYAASQKDPYYVKELLKKGVNSSQEDRLGYLPIHYAAMSGSVEVLKFFSQLNAQSYSKATPLDVAIQHGQKEAVDYLIDKGAKLTTNVEGYTTLHVALHEGNREIISAVLRHPSINEMINKSSEVGGTPLMLACELRDAGLVEQMIGMGADPKTERKDGVTAIEIAILLNFNAVLSSLLQHAEPTGQAIETAMVEGNLETIKLLENSLLYSFKNSCKDTVLIIALLHGNVSAALYVIENCRDLSFLNAENEAKETAFTISAALSLWEVLAALDKKSVTVDLAKLIQAEFHPYMMEIFLRSILNQEQVQELLLIAAKAGKYQAISEVLLPKGANLEQLTGPNGWGMIHYLAKADGIFLFKKLFKSSDLLLRLPEDKTIAYIAAENGSLRVLDFLLNELKISPLSLERHFNENHLFFAVIESGEVSAVEKMFTLFPDKFLENTPLDAIKTCPVHLAAKLGAIDILKILVEKKADLNAIDKEGFTCLDYAVRLQSRGVTEFLLEKKAKVTSYSLYEAAASDAELFQLVFQSNTDPQLLNASLMLSIYKGDIKTFLILNQAGASLNHLSPQGWTPLLRACYNGQIDMVQKILLDTNLDLRTMYGKNALQLAITRGHAHIVQLLVSAGFSKEIPSEDGKTPLTLASHSKGIQAILKGEDYSERITTFWAAIESGEKEAIEGAFNELPLNETIYIEAEKAYATPLQWVIRSKLNVCPELVQRAINDPLLKPNVCDSEGNNLAHLLYMQGQSAVTIPGLILFMKNNKGQIPLHLAAKNADLEVLSSLHETSGNLIRSVDNEGKTPLFYAIEGCKESNLKYLILQGADLNHYTHKLYTPLLRSLMGESLSQINLLLNHGANPDRVVTSIRCTLLHLASKIKNGNPILLSLLINGAKCDRRDLSHTAAESTNTLLLRLMAAKGKLLSLPDDKGMHPIHVAAMQEEGKALTVLLENGEDLLEQPIEGGEDPKFNPIAGATPLQFATLSGNVKRTEQLLALHASPTAKTKKGLSTLSFAAMSPSSKAMLEVFYSYRLSNEPKELLKAVPSAIAHDNLDAVISLYQRGIPVNAQMGGYGTGLHMACESGALMCTQWFLQQGGDPAQQCHSGENCFELSAVNDSYEQFRLLMEFTNQDGNQVNQRGETLLHLASRAGRLQHVMLLLLMGADLNKVDNKGFTPLHNAVKEGRLDVANMLIACGADTHSGATPPAQLSSNEAFATLFSASASIASENQPGDTRLHFAVRWRNHTALRLICHLEEIDTKNQQGKTPLHLAVHIRDSNAVLLLLREGANSEIKDNQEKTPKDYVDEPSLLNIFTQSNGE